MKILTTCVILSSLFSRQLAIHAGQVRRGQLFRARLYFAFVRLDVHAQPRPLPAKKQPQRAARRERVDGPKLQVHAARVFARARSPRKHRHR